MVAQDELIENLTFDELQIGQRATLRRTLTRDDISAFALVSGDVNPAHVDAEYAQGTRFGGVIAHGMFAGALISSLLGTEFPGPGTIYIEQLLRFHRPVHVGDTLEITCSVLTKDAANHNVRLQCEVRNQRGEAVVSGDAVVRAPTRKVARPRASLPTLHLFDPQARIQAWLASLAVHPPVRCAVVHPCDEASLRGALDAAARGLIEPVLVAPGARLDALAAELGLSLNGIERLEAAHSHASASAAAELAASGGVQMMMKGSLPADELVQAVRAEPGLRTERRLSHVFRFEVPAYAKPLLVTDAMVNIAPDLAAKADIVCNAVALAAALGVEQPRVALLSAQETVSPKIGSTLDAAALCKMAERGQIRGARLDGPLTFDNAVSLEAARLKGIDSPVAGEADVLLVPDLEAGNMLAKQLEYLAGAAGCGVILGARVPIALNGRADAPIVRAASAALATVAARHRA